MEFKTVLYETRDRVATITLNRPESLNALDAQMGADLGAALRAAAGDPTVRAVVLTGAGRAFCAGGDIKAMAAGLPPQHAQERRVPGTPGLPPQHAQERRVPGTPGLAAAENQREAPVPTAPYDLGAILRNFHDVVAFLYEMDRPVVAAIHGPAVGAGMSLAMTCDLRIAAEDASFSQAFVRLGLSPDGGSTWLLPRLMGPARAAQLMMTGETINAHRALEWGLLNQVVSAGQDLSQAMELARRLATFSPQALGSLKRLLRSSERRSFAEQLEAEAAAQSANASTGEFRAAVAAFLQRK